MSLTVLVVIASVLPVLWSYISINAILGYALGVIYVRDRYGRYHYALDGRYVSTEESCCLQLFAIIFGIGVPAVITIWSLPYYALSELVIATFGSEIVALFGGFGWIQ